MSTDMQQQLQQRQIIDMLIKKQFTNPLMTHYKNIPRILEEHPVFNNCLPIIKHIADSFAVKNYYIEDWFENDLFISDGKLSFFVSVNFPWVAIELFKDEPYKLGEEILTKDEYTVLDIGSNKGYASLYFSQNPWCKDVYGFELMPKNYEWAMRSLEFNQELKNKIKFFNIGLGNEDKEVTAYDDGRDYAISICPDALNRTNVDPSKIKCTSIPIKKSSVILKDLISENKINNIILKIDVEGAEYEIFEDIAENYPEIFAKTDIIIGESHMGQEKLNDILFKFGYDLNFYKQNENGTCSFLYLKKTDKS